MVLGAPAANASSICPSSGTTGGIGGTANPGTCGANGAVTISVPASTDYERLEWTSATSGFPTGLTFGNFTGADASVTTNDASGGQPFYMLSFEDPTDLATNDQILMIEFQPNTLSGTNMVLDPNSTLFNLFDNTSGQYLTAGGQQNANSLSYWMGQYAGLSNTSIDALRIGIGLSGGCGNQACAESYTINSLDVNSNIAATPEPASVALLGTGLCFLGGAIVMKRRQLGALAQSI